VTVQNVIDQTGFELVIPEKVPTTTPPTTEEVRILREVVDPTGFFLVRRMKA
jgi:glutaconate CoA-transferase subunit B